MLQRKRVASLNTRFLFPFMGSDEGKNWIIMSLLETGGNSDVQIIPTH